MCRSDLGYEECGSRVMTAGCGRLCGRELWKSDGHKSSGSRREEEEVILGVGGGVRDISI